MAIIPINGPVEVDDVADILGHPISYDVGTLCKHPNINKWAKYKPVPNNELFFDSAESTNVNNRKCWQGLSQVKRLDLSPIVDGVQNCGFWLPRLTGYSSWLTVKAAMDHAIANYNWNKSFTDEHFPNIPKRLGDFRGYVSDPIAPFFGWQDGTSGNKYFSPNYFTFGYIHSNVESPWNGLDWYDFPELENLNSQGYPYLCCAIFKGSNTQLFNVYSSNDVVGSEYIFDAINTASWQADIYKCYWFFASSQPTSISIPDKIIPLYSTGAFTNPFTYTLNDSLDILFSNFRYGYALGSQLINYQLLDGTQYYGPYGIHSNFNNSISGTGFIIALDFTNNAGGNLLLKGTDIAISFDNFMGDVVINSTDILGLYDANTAGATNKLNTGISIANGTTKTIYIEVGVKMSGATSSKQFDFNFTNFTIYNSLVELANYSVQCKYRTLSTRTFYRLSTGQDFTTI